MEGNNPKKLNFLESWQIKQGRRLTKGKKYQTSCFKTMQHKLTNPQKPPDMGSCMKVLNFSRKPQKHTNFSHVNIPRISSPKVHASASQSQSQSSSKNDIYYDAFHQFPIPGRLVDSSGKFIDVNTETERVFGMSSLEMNKMRYLELLPKEIHKYVEGLQRQFFRGIHSIF